MNVKCPECGAANHKAADVCSLCGRLLKEPPAQDKPDPKARKLLTPSLIVVGGIVFGLVIALANNMRGWELALGMLITTGCAIGIAAAVFVSDRRSVRDSQRTATPTGLVVLAVVVLVAYVCWVVSPTDEPVSNRHGTAGELSRSDPEAEQTVRELQATGFITSLNVGHNEARVDVAMWVRLTLDQKRGIVSLLSRHFEANGSTGRVTVRGSLNDHVLATYSVWSGVKIKV